MVLLIVSALVALSVGEEAKKDDKKNHERKFFCSACCCSSCRAEEEAEHEEEHDGPVVEPSADWESVDKDSYAKLVRKQRVICLFCSFSLWD